MDKFDVIVIGAGNGGLSAATFASQKGFKTLLFEKHNLPGGAVTSFRRGRFEFEPSLHEICEMGTEENPGSTRKLFDEMQSDAKLICEKSCYHIISKDPEDSFDISLPAGIDNFCDTIEKHYPGQGEKVRLFLDYAEKSIITADKLSKKHFHLKDIPEILNVFRMVSHSSDEMMDKLGISKTVQRIITPYWSYIGEPTSTLCAFMMGILDYCYITEGAGVPSMFSHELSLSLDKVIRKNGGQIFYNSPVTKILVKNHRAYGVIANGKEYYADHIICNCFPNDVFGKMIHRRHVPLIELKRINAKTLALSLVNVYLGLNKTYEELGIKDYSTFVVENADSTEQWKKCHKLGGEGWEITNCLNTVISDCSPKGTSHVTITTLVYGEEWAKIKPEDYKKKKLEIAEKMIDFYEKNSGISIKPYIEEIEVATPVTFSRYLGTPNGTPYGYQHSFWDSIFLRTMNSKRERSIKGLYFVGAHAEEADGYNQTYKSGKRVVSSIKRSK